MIVAAMIAQAERAEAGLAEMSRRTATLREELSALGGAARLDNSTHLLNRLAIESHLSVALKAPQSQIILALVVIDHFDIIVRDHGSGIGERVLRAAGETLRDHCVPHRVGRWDRTMLVTVFEGVTETEVTRRLEAATAAFARRSLKLRENDRALGTVTLSAGMAHARGRSVTAAIDAAAALVIGTHQTKGNMIVWEARIVGVPPTSPDTR